MKLMASSSIFFTDFFGPETVSVAFSAVCPGTESALVFLVHSPGAAEPLLTQFHVTVWFLIMSVKCCVAATSSSHLSFFLIGLKCGSSLPNILLYSWICFPLYR